MYPPPGVSPAMLAEIERFEGMAGIVLATGFGGLFAGLSVSVAAKDSDPLAAGVVTVASFVSGLAAGLACYGLLTSLATAEPRSVYVRKWAGANLAVGVLLFALVQGLLGAVLLLV